MVRLESEALADEGNSPIDDLGNHLSEIFEFWEQRKRWIFGLPEEDPPVPPPTVSAQLVNLDLYPPGGRAGARRIRDRSDPANYAPTGPAIHRNLDD